MTLRFECEGAVALLTIDRPKVHNALDFEASDALVDAWIRFRDDDDLRVAILTGAGERAFCAGADLRGVGDFYKKLTSATSTRSSRRRSACDARSRCRASAASRRISRSTSRSSQP